MTRIARVLLLALFVCASGFAAWRIVAVTQADRWASEDPSRALGWLPGHPVALLALAETQLRRGELAAAEATARRLLAVEPLEGRGFRVLAAAAQQQGRADEALALYGIAVRRSPRDTAARAWLIERYLLAGDYRNALVHIDALLRTSPGQGTTLLPLLVQLSADPRFASALADVLVRRPTWRAGLLGQLATAADPRAGDQVMSALNQRHGLDRDEFNGWVLALQRQSRWGDAYARWVGSLDLHGKPVPLVFNGDFETPLGNQGFDWHLLRIPGVSLVVEQGGGATGSAAHATFRGRPVAQVPLEQPLLLAPGSYRFSARVRTGMLRSDRGLEWAISCVGQGEPIATSERLQGSTAWRRISMPVVVPGEACPAQWLRLRNPVPAGSVQQVSGEIWFDDVAIVPDAGLVSPLPE